MSWGDRGSQTESVIEAYDRRTDRDGENRFTTELAFIRAGEDLLRNNRRGLYPRPFPMAQSSETNGRFGLQSLFQMMGVFAEFERAMIQERVKSGLERARAQGKRLGRRPIDARKEAAIRADLREGKAGI